MPALNDALTRTNASYTYEGSATLVLSCSFMATKRCNLQNLKVFNMVLIQGTSNLLYIRRSS